MGRAILEIAGERYGTWTVLERISLGKQGRWKCRCDCGTERDVLQSELRQGRSKGCGCDRLKADMVGQRFGAWEVLSRAAYGQKAKWLCRCDCGIEREVLQLSLRQGKSTNCGCVARQAHIERETTHGATDTHLYRVWAGIKQRCENPANPSYHNYGWRGITMCSRWADSYEAFEADMSPWPGKGYTIDRIDNNGPYDPGNCRWATGRQQNLNARRTTQLTFNGATMSVTEWAERIGITRGALHQRLKRHPIHVALTMDAS